jgi:hypothetical protein
VQQSESFKTPKPVQHKGSFKVPKPVQQSQQNKILTLAQSSEQIQSTKGDISDEQAESTEMGAKSRSILIAKPRNDTITKEDREMMRKQILRYASESCEQTKSRKGGIKVIINEDRKMNQSSEVKGDDLVRMIEAELDKIPSRSPSPIRNQESLNCDGPSKSTRASISRTGQIRSISANTRSRSATRQNTSDGSDNTFSGTIQLNVKTTQNTRRMITRNVSSKRKEHSIPNFLLEGSKPKKEAEAVANKAKPMFYDGGFSTGPIEIKPLPSWCDVKPKHPKPEPLPKLENEQNDFQLNEGNENTEKLIKTSEEENKEDIQHLEHEIMKFMAEKAAKEEAKKLAAKKRQEEERRKAEEEQQRREEEERRREFLNKCQIEAREHRIREVRKLLFC